MALIADILLVAGALGAAVYCLVLSRRLQQFTRLEDGVGGAIAVLSAQVDDMTRALKEARAAAHSSENALAAQTARAEQATERLSLMLASLHDLPEPNARQPAASAPPAAAPAAPAAAPAQGPAPTPGYPAASPAQPLSDALAPDRPIPPDREIPESAAADPITAEIEPERRPRFLRRRSAPPPAAAPMTTPQTLSPETAQ